MQLTQQPDARAFLHLDEGIQEQEQGCEEGIHNSCMSFFPNPPQEFAAPCTKSAAQSLHAVPRSEEENA